MQSTPTNRGGFEVNKFTKTPKWYGDVTYCQKCGHQKRPDGECYSTKCYRDRTKDEASNKEFQSHQPAVVKAEAAEGNS